MSLQDSQTVGSESDSDDESNAIFSKVLSTIRLDNLPTHCAAIRKCLTEMTMDIQIEPVAIEQPLFGSYHVLFPIRFNDNVRWLLKVPACGTKSHFDRSAASALKSEAMTMLLIYEKTSIPVPVVYSFDPSLDNDLGCPFILMSFIEGKPLYDCWFDRSTTLQKLHLRRRQTLQDLALAMAELNCFSFIKGGSPIFDQDGTLIDIGPMRCIDHKGMLDRMQDASDNDTALYFDSGPFLEPKSFYCHAISRERKPARPLHIGLQKLLQLFLHWIPESHEYKDRFVLTHPDLDIQNIIVSEDGHIQGIIDWDGVAALPRSVGNQSYPSWLTRDWDPAMYGWNEEMGRGVEPTGVWEDSPQTLAQHRAEYEDFISTHISSDHKNLYSLTTASLYVENLLIAAENPLCRFEILRKFVHNIIELGNQDPDVLKTIGSKHIAGYDNTEKPDIFSISDALAEGNLQQKTEFVLRKGFEALLQRGV